MAKLKTRPNQTPPSESGMASRGVRETVESIVVAIILAFLFRAFEAEAFVIPTGSMAPTLQGRHLDVECSQCGHRYRAGASGENADSRNQALVVKTTCPVCRYTMDLDRKGKTNEDSFTGDRILVVKFLDEPDRWDVVVFKYPRNAKQNYIKRLVGKPEEVIRILHGDIYLLPYNDLSEEERALLTDEDASHYEKKEMVNALELERFKIVRKPSHKVVAMLHLVDDTKHIPVELREAGWPSRWRQWARNGEEGTAWEMSDDGNRYTLETPGDTESWLRYHHLPPRAQDWEAIESGEKPLGMDVRNGSLITDFYAYNVPTTKSAMGVGINGNPRGNHWVGDLALECIAEVKSDSGELILDLVEGGVHFECRIDVATGEATLSFAGGERNFINEKEETTSHPTGKTKLRGAGRYKLRFANVDNELHLWVNNKAVAFDIATYDRDPHFRPGFNAVDPLDAAPLGIGSSGVSMEISRLRVLRDVYYVAVRSGTNIVDYPNLVRQLSQRPSESEIRQSQEDFDTINSLMSDPYQWPTSVLFDPSGRRDVTFFLNADQFFPMGDNSPQSSDARLWGGGHSYVERQLLTGKALLIYWPHAWRQPIPFLPNFERMGLIR